MVERLGPVARLLHVLGLARRPARDGGLQVAEDLQVDLVRRAVLGEQVLESVLVVVVVGELEDRLAQLLRQPDHGASDGVGVHATGPTSQGALRHEVGRRRGVEEDHRVGVLLQVARRHQRGDVALHDPRDDRRLVLAEGQQDDAPRLEDGAHAHRDRASRHVLVAEEVARRVDARDAVERDESRAREVVGAGLVEPDVPGAPDAEQLQVDAARLGDHLLVAPTGLRDLLRRDRAIGDVDVGRVDVHEVEQVLLHEPDVALQVLGPHREVLVEIERDHVLEGELLLLMEAHELVVDPGRRRTGGEPEHRPAALGGARAYQGRDLPGDVACRGRGAGEHLGADLLARREDGSGGHGQGAGLADDWRRRASSSGIAWNWSMWSGAELPA